VALPVASDTGTMPVCAPPRAHTNIIEASWLVNGGHGASLRHHTRRQTDRQTQPCPASPQSRLDQPLLEATELHGEMTSARLAFQD
jgi:hypothetical protein